MLSYMIDFLYVTPLGRVFRVYVKAISKDEIEDLWLEDKAGHRLEVETLPERERSTVYGTALALLLEHTVNILRIGYGGGQFN